MLHRRGTLPPVAAEFFREGDCLAHPLGLVDPYGMIKPSECQLSRRAIRRISSELRWQFWNSFRVKLGFTDWKMDRPLSPERYGDEADPTSYETELKIEEGGFEDMFDLYRKQTRLEALSVCDFGCGEASAFGNMLELEGVDRDASIGITLSGAKRAPANARNRIAEVNVARLIPEKWLRADVLTSVWGGVTYHPLNSVDSTGRRDTTFGVLHAINCVKIGGLIFLSDMSYYGLPSPGEVDRPFYGKVVAQFIELGILGIVPDFHRFSSDPRTGPSVAKVLRRPTLAEIKSLLKVNASGIYDPQKCAGAV